MITIFSTTVRRRARGTGAVTDRGMVTAFTVIWVGASLVLAGLVLDAGLAVSRKVNAREVANAAARAGARELDIAALRLNGIVRIDPTKARSAAARWIARAGLHGTVTVTANAVTVSVNTSQPTQLLGLVGIATIAVHATATADAITP